MAEGREYVVVPAYGDHAIMSNTRPLPTVEELAEVIADSHLWLGAWQTMAEPERNLARHTAAAVLRRITGETTDGR